MPGDVRMIFMYVILAIVFCFGWLKGKEFCGRLFDGREKIRKDQRVS